MSGFVAALSEVSSVTDPTYGPDSIGVGETEISSLTDPTYAGVDEGAIAVSDVVVVGVGVYLLAISRRQANHTHTYTHTHTYRCCACVRRIHLWTS